MKYENFLEEVQKENTDEFQEVNDILTRYDTLVRENQKLDKDHYDLEQKLKQMKDNTNKYIKDKQTELLRLNNETTQQKAEFEDIMDKQNVLKEQAADISSKKNEKVSELAQILMAIENIEQTCFWREGTKAKVLHPLPVDERPANFDQLELSVAYATKQLNAIKYYIGDYSEIIKNVYEQDKGVREYLTKLENEKLLI